MKVGVSGTPSVFVLDGAMGTLLERWGVDFDTAGPMWSSSVLLANPALVQRAHQAYIDAGCDVLSTCTYQMFEGGCTASGVTMTEVVDRAVRTARQTMPYRGNEEEEKEKAAETAGTVVSGKGNGLATLLSTGVGNMSGRSVLLAGSLGPYGASLPGGHEYLGDYVLENSIIEVFHARRLAAFVGQLDGRTYLKVDFLLLETFPRLDEALGILSWMEKEETFCSAPVCFSFVSAPVEVFLPEDADTTALDNWWKSAEASVCLPDGHTFEDALLALRHRRAAQLMGFGVNCASPLEISLVASAMLKKKRNKGEPALTLLLYPNSGETYVEGQWHEKTRPVLRDAAVRNTTLEDLQWSLARGGGDARSCAEFAIRLLRQRPIADDWLFEVVFCGMCCRSGPEDIAAIKSICES